MSVRFCHLYDALNRQSLDAQNTNCHRRYSMRALLNNGWIQSIVGGLLCSGLIVIGKRLFARNNSYRQAFFSIGVATIVFFVGEILQATVQFFLEGDNLYWDLMLFYRKYEPQLLILQPLLGSALSAVPTGLAVLKGRTLNQCVAYGVIWAPISLAAVDLIYEYRQYHSPFPQLITWNLFYFSMLSDLARGVVGGFIIGAASHLYFKHVKASSRKKVQGIQST